MPRPPKDKHLLRNVPLRVMLTEAERALIGEAALLESLDVSAWARPLLLRAAQERVARQGQQAKRQEGRRRQR